MAAPTEANTPVDVAAAAAVENIDSAVVVVHDLGLVVGL